jgi:hypothetical protein
LTPEDIKALTSILKNSKTYVWKTSAKILNCFQEISYAIDLNTMENKISRLAIGINKLLELILEIIRQKPGTLKPILSDSIFAVEVFVKDLVQHLAYEIVDMLANVYWRPNMISTHNPQSIFNVDICGGMPAVIIKMLITSELGQIKLLPALPKQWPSGQIEGILCRGQIEVKRLKWNDKRVELSIVSQISQNITITIPRGFKEVKLVKGNADIFENLVQQGKCVVALVPGEIAEIHFIHINGK